MIGHLWSLSSPIWRLGLCISSAWQVNRGGKKNFFGCKSSRTGYQSCPLPGVKGGSSKPSVNQPMGIRDIYSGIPFIIHYLLMVNSPLIWWIMDHSIIKSNLAEKITPAIVRRCSQPWFHGPHRQSWAQDHWHTRIPCGTMARQKKKTNKSRITLW